jgi:hypothetical protein
LLPVEEMLFRLIIICMLAGAFGMGFSELVNHTEPGPAAASPCYEWSNPRCAPGYLP